MHDLVIRGALVVDGSGAPGYSADVAVRDGAIAEIGRVSSRGQKEIDAGGLVVSPGFIDAHTHLDAQVHWDPLMTPSPLHGVTTVVMGNCGFTLAPCHESQSALVMRNLERAEDISAKAMALGVKWGWETFPEYLDALERLPKGINCASYVGHSALRTWAMGERAFEQVATTDDLQKMKHAVAEAMRAGAIGLSTSRSNQHETSDDRPVASRLASWEEVQTLVGALGGGVFELALEPRAPDAEGRAEFYNRLKALAVETGVPVTFGLAPGLGGSTGIYRERIRLLESTAAEGGEMFGQTLARDFAILISFQTQLPFDRLPEWRDLRARPLEEQERLLRSDAALRKRLARIAHEGPYGKAISGEARKPEWDRIHVYDRTLPPHRTIAEIAKERGADPAEILINLALERGLKRFFLQCLQKQNLDAVLEVLRHPMTVMTFSDTGAHVSQMSDCSLHTHLLAYWVRERQAIALEEAVRMVTHASAQRFGIAGRGLLKPGLAADINIFDPATLTPELPEVVFDLPGGARRLVQRCSGMHATIVAGQVIVENGKPTGALPGRLLRGCRTPGRAATGR